MKQIFQETYQSIKDFLLTDSQSRNMDQLIDMRNILEGFSFFVQFTNTKSSDFIEMCRYLQIEMFDFEQTLFKQGDPADKFYVILKGEVKIFIKSPGLDEIKQVGTSGVGDCFGELALLFNSDRNATIVVGRDTELMVLHKNVFNKYMSFQSSDQANQAYNLLNVIEPFLALSFPDKIRLASKMDYKQFPSNVSFVTQGSSINNFYIIESGSVKLYRTISFNINRNGLIQFQTNFDPTKPNRSLRIEIDEIGPGRYIGDYELQNYKPSQYTAVTSMQTTVFMVSLIDFNLMSQYQLAEVCSNSKPYPTDEKIREQFLDSVKWKVFRKQLVSKLQLEVKSCSHVRDPNTMAKFQYQKDLKQFAVKTLSYDKLMEHYLYGNQEDEKQEFIEFTQKKQHQQKQRPFFHNVDEAIRKLKQSQQSQRNVKNSRQILPKINPKVGSDIYNILISK